MNKDRRIKHCCDANALSHDEMRNAFASGYALAFDWCGDFASVVEFLEEIGIKEAKVYYNDSRGWAEVRVTHRPQ